MVTSVSVLVHRDKDPLFLSFLCFYYYCVLKDEDISVKSLNAVARSSELFSHNVLVLGVMTFLRAVCVRHVLHMTLCGSFALCHSINGL